MFRSETRLRVRYAETDRMGYAYYGYYAMYYEVARVECLRQLGMTYKELEAQGTMMPVLENNSTYLSPAQYDDELTIVTFIREKPGVRIRFDYEIYTGDKKMIHSGTTLLVFADTKSGKPRRPPDVFMKLLEPYF